MTDLSKHLPHASAATIAKNPGLFAAHVSQAALISALIEVPKKRLRQCNGPRMNKTEDAFFQHLRFSFDPKYIFIQAVTLILGNGVRYTPDFVVMGHGAKEDLPPVAYEVKGKHAWEDSIVKLKIAARVYPPIKFILAWRDGPEALWNTQHILP